MVDTVIDVQPCRAVTSEEVEHYQEFGWVQLKRFVDPEFVRGMLDIARRKMGDDADSNAPRGGAMGAGDEEPGEQQPGIGFFNADFAGGLGHPLMQPLIRSAGKGAKQLMKRKADVGARYYSDLFVPKLPSAKPSQHGGNGPTAFHQDFITFAVDRTGGMTMWFPLEAYGPDSGTMSFVNHSHRMGVLGDYTTYGNGDALDTYPELLDDGFGLTEPITYELGDITVHSHLTIHGAGMNVTDRPRWAYILIVQPADICWDGSPCPNFDTSAMRPWQAMDDPARFPVIS